MGTSSSYKGSPGWDDTRRRTTTWLDHKGVQGDGDADGDLSRLVASVIRNLTRQSVDSTSANGSGGTSGAFGGVARGRIGAVVSGGIAIAGAFGLRHREVDALSDIELDLSDLEEMSPIDQADRIVEAASGGSALVEEAELREVNAQLVWWAIEQDNAPTAIEIVKQWVTEYVFRAWLTEAGDRLRDGSRDGAETHALEREMRGTVDAGVSGLELPIQGIRSSDFEASIQSILDLLRRIFT